MPFRRRIFPTYQMIWTRLFSECWSPYSTNCALVSAIQLIWIKQFWQWIEPQVAIKGVQTLASDLCSLTFFVIRNTFGMQESNWLWHLLMTPRVSKRRVGRSCETHPSSLTRLSLYNPLVRTFIHFVLSWTDHFKPSFKNCLPWRTLCTERESYSDFIW